MGKYMQKQEQFRSTSKRFSLFWQSIKKNKHEDFSNKVAQLQISAIPNTHHNSTQGAEQSKREALKRDASTAWIHLSALMATFASEDTNF